ncbi:MAG: hypothetical protein Q8O10_08805 [candidate division Zixibacteria bacterium]|nr:hypothetical protein [candidate division Zixibacteria bacterium]
MSLLEELRGKCGGVLVGQEEENHKKFSFKPFSLEGGGLGYSII